MYSLRTMFFRDLDLDVKTACELVATVRWFDTVMLREVLNQNAGERFETWTQEDFGHLLLRLKRTQLLVWNKGYTLDPDLRHLINKHSFSSAKSAYIAVNKTALTVYQEWLEKPVDNRNLYVIEELYHLACLRRAGQELNLEERLQQRLAQYQEWITDVQVRRHVLERLKGEMENDQELNQFTGDQARTSLAQLVQKAIDALAREPQPTTS
jgi:hypothetical protein